MNYLRRILELCEAVAKAVRNPHEVLKPSPRKGFAETISAIHEWDCTHLELWETDVRGWILCRDCGSLFDTTDPTHTRYLGLRWERRLHGREE